MVGVDCLKNNCEHVVYCDGALDLEEAEEK
jgi:hypothetical protein